VSFRPDLVQILEKGEDYTAKYSLKDVRIEVDLRFEAQGRTRVIVREHDTLLEDIELRMPTTNALTRKMQATALIMSAVQRNVEKLASESGSN
jgi:hypothetical protein